MALLNQDDPRLGTVLADRYRIDALIGEGGMGKVYSAEHVLMKKRLAVKVLHRELTSVPEVVARFEREAMAAANIEHPNVAAATDFGKLADGSVFLVLEYVQGRNLRDELAEGSIALERALRITRQIAAGLGSAHAQGIVHRDLKPENVMLLQKGNDPDFVKVLDFGIAKVPMGEIPAARAKPDQVITKAGMVFGTPEYMAPEQALGQMVDGRADLYALGVMLFEMLAGARPFSSQSPVGILGQQLASAPPSISERAGGVLVPPAVETLTQKLLARDRDQRFASAADVVETLDVLLTPPKGRGGYRFTLADGSPSLPPPPPDSAARVPSGSTGAERPLPRFNTAGGMEGVTPPFAPSSVPPPLAPAQALPQAELRPAHGAQLLWLKARRLFNSVEPRAAELRERLPTRLRQSLRPVPTRTLVMAGGISTLLVSTLAAALIVTSVRACSNPPEATSAPGSPATPGAVASGPSSVALAAPPSASVAPPAELALANGRAVTLEGLASKYPADPEVLVELARVSAAAKDFPKATASAERALALAPALRADERLKRVLFEAAQTSRSGAAALSLLQGPMGPQGAEVLWDLASDASVKATLRQSAGQWLRSAAFRSVAPEPLRLAADLRTARTCEAAHALLPKAGVIGDSRSLPQLEAWAKTSGCGPHKKLDCMPCLRTDSALQHALAAVRARTNPAGLEAP